MIGVGNPFLMFVRAFLFQCAGHFALVGLVFLVVWRWGQQRFRGARITTRARVDRRQILFEAKNTLGALAAGTATAVAVSLLYADGMTELTTDASSLGWPSIALGLIAFLIFNDAWFYAWHRVLHHPRLFRYVHVVHHRSVDVNPFTVYSFHPLEALIMGSAVVPFVLVVPLYLPVLGIAQIIGLTNNIMSHLGYEFLPRWYGKVPPFRYMNTATFHSQHHTKVNGNYGLLFRVWDRVFGTELPGYEEAFLRRGDAQSPPPAIDPR